MWGSYYSNYKWPDYAISYYWGGNNSSNNSNKEISTGGRGGYSRHSGRSRSSRDGYMKQGRIT
jgi:hypothetical protein